MRFLPAILVAAILVAFTAHAARQRDPSARADAFRPDDRRVHRYGTLTFEQTTQVIDDLRAHRADAAMPEEKAALSTELADVYVARQMFPEALDAIDDARASAPGQPRIIMRAALIRHHLGRRAEAETLIEDALRLAPGDLDVARAAETIRSDH